MFDFDRPEITEKHWRVLCAVNTLYASVGVPPPAYRIAEYMCLAHDDILSYLRDMCDYHWTEDGPWLLYRCGRYLIAGVMRDDLATGGYSALEHARANPSYRTHDVRGWKNEVLSGLTADGFESPIDNAVIGGEAKQIFSDAEDAAHKCGEKFATHFDPNQFKTCPDCKMICRITEMRSDGKICRPCNKRRASFYRKRKNQK